MKRTAATIIREYGPFPDVTHVRGVSYDGTNIWIATGDTLNAIDTGERENGARARCPRARGNRLRWPTPVPDLRGSHPEGRSDDRPRGRYHPDTRRRRLRNGVGGREPLGRAASQTQDPLGRSADRRDPSHHRVQPFRHRRHPGSTANSGTAPGNPTKANCAQFNPQTGEVLERIDMPPGVAASGLEFNGGDTFFCGGGSSGKARAVRRPRQS